MKIYFILKVLIYAVLGFIISTILFNGVTEIIPTISIFSIILIALNVIRHYIKLKQFKIPLKKVKSIRIFSDKIAIEFDNIINQKTTCSVYLNFDNLEKLRLYLETHFHHKLFFEETIFDETYFST